MRWFARSGPLTWPSRASGEGTATKQRGWLLLVGLVTVLFVSSLLAAPSSADTMGTLLIGVDTTLAENHNGNIVITADGVTLDCAGYTVSSTNPAIGEGIGITDRADVTVKNCHATGFSNVGFRVENSTSIVLTGNTSTNNNQGFEVQSSGALLSDNTASDNDAWGFFLAGSGATLSGNTATDNTLIGFALNNASDNELDSNHASRNPTNFDIGGSNSNVFTGNSADGGENGFHLGDSNDNTLTNNSVSDTALGGGFVFNNSSDNTLTGNVATNNGAQGFHIFLNSVRNSFRDNRAHNNNDAGFRDSTAGSGDAGTGNSYVGNLCIGNAAGRSSPNGLCLGHGETVNLVQPNGRWHLRRPNGDMHSFFYGDPGDVALFGDWDGDGLDTPGMYRPTNGFAYLTNDLPPDGGVGFGDPALTFFFGGPGDQVFVGDWDGDGIDTLGISRNGKMFLANTNATVVADLEFWFGTPTDIAVGGDPDGDGKDSVFLYRPSSGFTYFTNSTPVGPNDVAPTHGTLFFGVPTDGFVIGDWDGDGTDTVGVFRPSDTTVYLRNANTTGPAHDSYVFGQAQWLPTAGIWS